jgi:hypothetical protein
MQSDIEPCNGACWLDETTNVRPWSLERPEFGVKSDPLTQCVRWRVAIEWLVRTGDMS